jgi:outer membrane biosynthesis protein TonB
MSCDRLRETDFAAFLAEPRDPAWQAFRAHYPGCRECSAELLRWSGLEQALRDVRQTAHPDDARLLAFRRAPASLPAAEREAVRAHLASCAPCRDALAAATSFDVNTVLARAKPARAERAEKAGGAWERAVEALRGLFGRPALAGLAVAALAAVLVLPFLLGDEPDLAPEAAPPVAEAPAPQPPPVVAEIPEPEAASPEPEPAAPEAVAEAAPPEPAAPPVEIAQAEAPPPAPEPVAPEPAPAPEPPAPRAAPAPPERPVASGTIASLGPEPVRFVDRPGLPSGRIGGAARSAGGAGAAPVALVPASVALTLEAQPTFYWYLAQPSAEPIELRVNDVDALQPVLAKTVPAPVRAGFHALRLRDHGARLAAGRNYEWLVATPDDAEGSGGIVQRVAPDPQLAAELGKADPAARLRLLAESGIWLDALDLLSRSIAARPADAELRRARAGLLEQAGLGAAAAADR